MSTTEARVGRRDGGRLPGDAADRSGAVHEAIRVTHSTDVWLPQTAVWLHRQIRHLPHWIESQVVCERTANLEQFGVTGLHSLEDLSLARVAWERALRRLRIRRHLGFLVDRMRQQRAQVLHSHFGHIGWHDLDAAESVGARHIVTFYGLDVGHLPTIDPRWRARYAELFRRVDRVLCEGSHMAGAVARLGCPDHKIRVHRLGIVPDEIAFRPRVWQPPEPLRVLIAASFREKKGIPYAIEALARLHADVPIEITLIGDADREPRSQVEKRKILAGIARSGLGGHVRRLGYRPHAVLLEEAYRHHVFLAPSLTADDGDSEGGAPVSVIEMAASGMPVVSTRHCDIPEIIRHGETGLLADERDVDGLVRQLRRLVECRADWGEMVERARRHIEANFNAMVQGSKLAEIYAAHASIREA